jgi:mono/diheme cytochrome c family protein
MTEQPTSVPNVDKLPFRTRCGMNKNRMCIMGLMYALTGLGFLNSQALGQTSNGGDINLGRKLATEKCSPCHVVRADQNQTLHPTGPSFEEIAQGGKTDPEFFRGFLKGTQSNVGHPGGMPNPQLLEEEIQEIGAYIRSLRK